MCVCVCVCVNYKIVLVSPHRCLVLHASSHYCVNARLCCHLSCHTHISFEHLVKHLINSMRVAALAQMHCQTPQNVQICMKDHLSLACTMQKMCAVYTTHDLHTHLLHGHSHPRLSVRSCIDLGVLASPEQTMELCSVCVCVCIVCVPVCLCVCACHMCVCFVCALRVCVFVCACVHVCVLCVCVCVCVCFVLSVCSMCVCVFCVCVCVCVCLCVCVRVCVCVCVCVSVC